jgi:NAD(P) transhydrogenase subunit alpha
LSVAVAVLRESTPGETRVALVPETIGRLAKVGCTVRVETGAGVLAGFPDAAYAAAGGVVVPDARAALDGAQIVLKVREPRRREDGVDEIAAVPKGAVVLGFLRPAANADLIALARAQGVTLLALERVPRTSRAQKMDALSSMATVAGYKAVLLAAERLPRFFPLLMTAAGTIPPARVFVLGAGVAGLFAIATARRLGAVVEAFDVRPAVQEEVESLGATFVALPADAAHAASAADGAGSAGRGSGAYATALAEDEAQRERALLAAHVAQADVVITTAQVPDKRAPVLVTRAMVEAMKPGSVLVDLAAESGGNCDATRPGEEVIVGGTRILGPVNLAASLPGHASQMLARNLAALVLLLVKDGALVLDFSDDIVAGACLTREAAATPVAAAPGSPA